MNSIRRIFKTIKKWSRRRRYREGIIVSQFIARDVRRDILVISTAKIDEGIIVGQVRTTNLLYLSKGLIQQPDYEPPSELLIDKMWDWSGQPWGGQANGTSIIDHNVEKS